MLTSSPRSAPPSASASIVRTSRVNTITRRGPDFHSSTRRRAVATSSNRASISGGSPRPYSSCSHLDSASSSATTTIMSGCSRDPQPTTTCPWIRRSSTRNRRTGMTSELHGCTHDPGTSLLEEPRDQLLDGKMAVHHEFQQERQIHAADHHHIRPPRAQASRGEATAPTRQVGEDDDRTAVQPRLHRPFETLGREATVAQRLQNILANVADPPDRVDQPLGQGTVSQNDPAGRRRLTHSPPPGSPAPAAWPPGAAG